MADCPFCMEMHSDKGDCPAPVPDLDLTEARRLLEKAKVKSRQERRARRARFKALEARLAEVEARLDRMARLLELS